MRTAMYGPLAAETYDLTHPVGRVDEDIAWLLERLPAHGALLDAGCGTGRLLVPLSRTHPDVTGADHAPEMLSHAVRYLTREGRSVPLLTLDLVAGPPERTFDHIVLLRTLEELEEPTRALGHLCSKLAPGGSLWFDIETWESAPRSATASADVSRQRRWDGTEIVTEIRRSIHPAERLEREQRRHNDETQTIVRHRLAPERLSADIQKLGLHQPELLKTDTLQGLGRTRYLRMFFRAKRPLKAP